MAVFFSGLKQLSDIFHQEENESMNISLAYFHHQLIFNLALCLHIQMFSNLQLSSF